MRVRRLRPLFAFGFLFSVTAIHAQTSTQTTPTRDPQAVSILTQCLQAVGGTQAISAIQDFTATGTITYNWANQPVQGSVTVRGRGTGQFRLDANLSDGPLSWAVNNGVGLYKKLDGSTKHMFFPNAVNFGSLTFPYMYIAARLADPSTNISYIGTDTKNGQKTYDIRLQQTFSSERDPNGILSKLTKRDFFIDTGTFQIIRTLDMVHPERASTIDIPHEMEFSDYRNINGVLVPFSISEMTVGQHTYTIQLDQMHFNTGLQDSDFNLGKQ
ncbi:MAG: LolA-like protein [Candidatus Acidiferrales bacterium]